MRKKGILECNFLNTIFDKTIKIFSLLFWTAAGKRGNVINQKRVVVVMPAYNASKTLERTVADLPSTIDVTILVDDQSKDETVHIAARMGLQVFVHDKNYGYGKNQKTCYREALFAGADIVVMVHPDYQYTPLLVSSMASMIAYGVYDVVLGSRILGGGALKGGMPLYKYVANRLLTAFQNFFTGAKLSEYHTGFRAFSKEVLVNLPIMENADDFIFDNQMLAQCICFNYRIGELSCPTKYFKDASSITICHSIKYGLGVIVTTLACWLQKMRVIHFKIFDPQGQKLIDDAVLLSEAYCIKKYDTEDMQAKDVLNEV